MAAGERLRAELAALQAKPDYWDSGATQRRAGEIFRELAGEPPPAPGTDGDVARARAELLDEIAAQQRDPNAYWRNETLQAEVGRAFADLYPGRASRWTHYGPDRK